jgi:hypothetical protein
MPTLHLGVIDIPYGPQPQAPRKASKRPGKARARKQSNTSITTGDVASILEAKYHVMEIFYEEHQGDVTSDLVDSLEGTVQSLMMGAPASIDPFGSATSKIEDRMKKFLDDREMERLGYPGVPTMAALMGVSHRFANPYKRRAPRPSFIDTGLYQSSMKAWVTT